MSRLGGRATWLLLAIGALLVWAGRSDAALLGPAAALPQAGPAPRLDRVDDGDVEARLAISGQMLVLRLRGGDLAALAERIGAGAEPEIVVRLDGEELLSAELREIRVEGDRLESRPPPPQLQLGSPGLLAAAIATRGIPPADAEADEAASASAAGEAHDRLARAAPAVLPVPEPGAGALLVAGLLGLGLARRRAAQASHGNLGSGS